MDDHMTPCRKAFETYMLNDLKCVVGSSDPYPAGIEREHWKTWQAATVCAQRNIDDAMVRAAHMARERRGWHAKFLRAVRLLTRMHAFMYPAPFKLDDGRVMVFRPRSVDPAEQLQQLSDELRDIPSQLDAIEQADPAELIRGANGF